MDPNATWQTLLEAYAEGNTDDCRQACGDLNDWLIKGGFPPCVVGIVALDRFMVQTVCTAYLLHQEIDSNSEGD